MEEAEIPADSQPSSRPSTQQDPQLDSRRVICPIKIELDYAGSELGQTCFQAPGLPPESAERFRATGKDFIPNPWGLQLPLIHHRQKRHYWIYGAGETFNFTNELEEQFMCFRYNSAEKFQTPDQRSQFVLIDEYNKSRIRLGRLKEMCDGQYQYPVKYLPAVTLSRPIVIVCSNFAPQVLYQVGVALLLARFNVVAIPDDQDEEFKEPND
jgi:hypothetical protein